MKLPEENPPRFPGETAIYEDDPFGLGEIDDSQMVEVSKDFLPKPEELVFKLPKKIHTKTYRKKHATHALATS